MSVHQDPQSAPTSTEQAAKTKLTRKRKPSAFKFRPPTDPMLEAWAHHRPLRKSRKVKVCFFCLGRIGIGEWSYARAESGITHYAHHNQIRCRKFYEENFKNGEVKP